MASLPLLAAFAVVAFSVAAFLSTPCTAQVSIPIRLQRALCSASHLFYFTRQGCRSGYFGDGDEQYNGTRCSPCHHLCMECFGSGADECFECMSVFVANGTTYDGRRVVECFVTCPSGLGTNSTTLECMQGAPPAVNG